MQKSVPSSWLAGKQVIGVALRVRAAMGIARRGVAHEHARLEGGIVDATARRGERDVVSAIAASAVAARASAAACAAPTRGGRAIT